MRSRDLSRWMWGEALSMLEQADRLKRQFFQLGSDQAQAWEPPIDVVETAADLRVQVALPGVAPDSIEIRVELEGVTVSGLRPFAGGAAAGGAHIHRLEIPYGRFARRIALPMDALGLEEQLLADGCLTLIFTKQPRGATR